MLRPEFESSLRPGISWGVPLAGGTSANGGKKEGDIDSIRIEPLFASRSLYLTLALFFDYPEDLLFPRLVARLAGIDIKCVMRALRSLATLRIIRVRREWGETGYGLNRAHPLYPELRSLFAKTRETRKPASRSSPATGPF
ncbi:MAG: hypothetical protein M1550_07340 [Deltaproteobacteria bacterium]|nr:hypothetical protein [Deltaproteobacteria bacterium]